MAEYRVEHVMGMPVEVDVRDERFDAGALDDAFAWLRRVDRLFSTYDPDSQICALDRGRLALEAAEPLVRDVLSRCERLAEETGGYFDARAGLGGRLDPSGYVKGWAIDRAVALLEAGGARNLCVNAGGDVCVRGAPGPGSQWRVGIRHPRRRDRLAAVLALTDAAVATSGAYERGAHIVDPHTGRPPAGVESVTVVGPELARADAYATAAFAMGEHGPAWTAGLRGHGAMTILAGGRVLLTRRLLRRRAAAPVTTGHRAGRDEPTAPAALRFTAGAPLLTPESGRTRVERSSANRM